MRSFYCFTLLAVVSLGFYGVAAEPKREGATSKMDCTLYTKPYTSNEHGAYMLPSGLNWKVMPRYVGRTESGERIVDDRVTLVLEDAEKRFWPVIAKMSIADAESLQHELSKVIAEKRNRESPES